MKKMLLIFISLLLISCSSMPKLVLDKVVEDKKEEIVSISDELISNNQVSPIDSSKTIIVYNIVEQDKKKSKISDETIRLFIADLFGTITTILTLRQLDDTP